jgi:hypothetical protein
MKGCAAHGCWAPAAGLAIPYCRDHQQLVANFRLWLAGVTNAFGSTFDADRRAWEHARRP